MDAGGLTSALAWLRPSEAGNLGNLYGGWIARLTLRPTGGPGQDYGNAEWGTRHDHQSERENLTQPSRYHEPC